MVGQQQIPWVVTLFVLFVLPIAVQAERHAVLIGVDYQECTPAPSPSRAECPQRLPGPLNDVADLRRLLVEHYQFRPEHITVLRNSEATRARILATLTALHQTTRPQDFIFIYFSGHGTSGSDAKLGLQIASSSGALVPSDFRIYDDDVQRTLAGLIIGRRDLRPLFTDLDRDRQLLVIFDACFSGNTVRSLRGAAGVAKYMPLAFPKQTLHSGGPFTSPGYTPPYKPSAKEPFPYTHLIYIAASDETETALDLQAGADGKAHGALTNALLLGLNGAADTNHDGVITYHELYEFAKRTVRGHTPQLLSQTTLERPVFETPTRVDSSQASIGAPREAGTLHVHIEAQGQGALRSQLATLPGITLTEGAYDVLVTPEGAGYTLYLSGGDKLCSVSTAADVAVRLTRYANVRELVQLTNPRQAFNVRLRTGDYAGKTVFFEGDRVDLTIESEREAALLLVNIDPQGYVNAIESAVTPRTPCVLTNVGVVEEPLGTEYFKLFAFPRKVPGLAQFTNTLLDPAGGEIAMLLALIKNERDWAETVREIVTVKQP